MDVKVRELEPHEWEFLKAVRIKSIDESPDAFKFTPKEARDLPDKYWEDALTKDHWFVGSRGGHVVAVGGLMPLSDDPDNFEIASVWIDPMYRGTGIFTEFVDQVKQQAKDLGIEVLYASIYTDNTKSEQAFKANGFELIGHQASRYQPDRQISRWKTPLVSAADAPVDLGL